MSDKPKKSLTVFIPVWLDDMGLTLAEFRVYAHLARRARKEDDIAWPAYESIGEDCKISRATVHRTLKSLEKMGLIERRNKPFGESRRYFVRKDGLVSNSLTRDTIEDVPIVSPENCISASHETPIVSPEALEGYPLKELHIRNSNSGESAKDLEFADWFRSTLPNGFNLKKSWRTTFAKAHDELVRLDGRTPEEIRKVCQWARNDEFWQTNFYSPKKLRGRNKDSIKYYDVFSEKMKADGSPNGTGKPPRCRL